MINKHFVNEAGSSIACGSPFLGAPRLPLILRNPVEKSAPHEDPDRK